MGMYCLANQLKAWNRRSAIKIRVMRTYCVMERRGSTQIKSREVIFHDEELLLQQLCPDLLALDENDFNSDGPSSEGDDKFMEGFESDEGESSVALLPPTSSTDCTTHGPVKRCLLDSFSSTKGGKKVKQSHVKLEKID
nr:replication factor A protein 1-like [Ipomoea batatas]